MHFRSSEMSAREKLHFSVLIPPDWHNRKKLCHIGAAGDSGRGAAAEDRGSDEVMR